jgi:hypothetical protein
MYIDTSGTVDRGAGATLTTHTTVYLLEDARSYTHAWLGAFSGDRRGPGTSVDPTIARRGEPDRGCTPALRSDHEAQRTQPE